MKGARFSEEQIIAILKEAEGGAKVTDYAAGTAFQTRLSTLGGASMAGWRSRSCAGCASLRKRIDG
jgi:hypothetical protein